MATHPDSFDVVLTFDLTGLRDPTTGRIRSSTAYFVINQQLFLLGWVRGPGHIFRLSITDQDSAVALAQAARAVTIIENELRQLFQKRGEGIVNFVHVSVARHPRKLAADEPDDDKELAEAAEREEREERDAKKNHDEAEALALRTAAAEREAEKIDEEKRLRAEAAAAAADGKEKKREGFQLEAEAAAARALAEAEHAERLAADQYAKTTCRFRAVLLLSRLGAMSIGALRAFISQFCTDPIVTSGTGRTKEAIIKDIIAHLKSCGRLV